MSSQIYLCRIHDNSVSKLFQEGKGGTLCHEVTHQKQSLRKVLCSYYWGYFLFFHCPQWAPKNYLAESTRPLLADCSKKGRVQLCVMKSHIRKESLRELLSSYYRTIFPFSPWASMVSQISFCRFHEKSVSKLVPEEYVVTLWDEFTDHKEVSQKASFSFLTDEIFFISVGLSAIKSSPFQIPERHC